MGGPFNYAENFPESLWVWVGQDQEHLDVCNRRRTEEVVPAGWNGSLWRNVSSMVSICTISDTLLVDAAGGRGHDIQAFLKKFPEASGRLIVEDQPHVIEDIRDLDQSIERIGFDLFDKQPIKGPSHYIASLYLRFPYL